MCHALVSRISHWHPSHKWVTRTLHMRHTTHSHESCHACQCITKLASRNSCKQVVSIMWMRCVTHVKEPRDTKLKVDKHSKLKDERWAKMSDEQRWAMSIRIYDGWVMWFVREYPARISLSHTQDMYCVSGTLMRRYISHTIWDALMITATSRQPPREAYGYMTHVSHYRTQVSHYRTQVSHYRTEVWHYRTDASHCRTQVSHYMTHVSHLRIAINLELGVSSVHLRHTTLHLGGCSMSASTIHDTTSPQDTRWCVQSRHHLVTLDDVWH